MMMLTEGLAEGCTKAFRQEYTLKRKAHFFYSGKSPVLAIRLRCGLCRKGGVL